MKKIFKALMDVGTIMKNCPITVHTVHTLQIATVLFYLFLLFKTDVVFHNHFPCPADSSAYCW